MNNKHNHQESGFAMVGVLIIFIIITVLGLSIVTLSFASVKTSTNERDNQSAYYIAEAGLTYSVQEIERKILEEYDHDDVREEEQFVNKLKTLANEHPIYVEFHDDKISVVNEISIADRFAKINIIFEEKIEEELAHQFIIESTGVIGEQERTVSSSFSVEWMEKYSETESGSYELPPFAVFTSGQIKIPQGRITGDIGTLNTGENGVYFANSGAVHTGKIYVPGGKESKIVKIENSNITSEIKSIDQSYVMPGLPPFLNFPSIDSCPESKVIETPNGNKYEVIKNCNLHIDNYVVRDSNYKLVMESDLKFDRMIFRENYTLTLDIGDEDKSIVVNHLDLTNGHIKLEGTGRLTIYVRDKITTGSGSTINKDGEINNLNIFYAGTNKFKLDGDQKIYGSIYIKNAEAYLTGSGGVYGNIFTGGSKITLSGGSNVEAQLILAPHAAVKVEAGGDIVGAVYSKTFDNSGGATVIHSEDHISLDGPISLAALGIESGSSGGSSGGGTNVVPTGAIPDISPPTAPREK